MLSALNRRSLVAGGVALATSTSALWSTAASTPAPGIGFGWVRDRPDPRDRLLQAPSFANPAPRPKTKDLSGQLPGAYAQGDLGSCTANAIAGAVQYARKVHNKPGDFVPSRLFIYYMERKVEGTIYTDSGAQIRDGITAVATYGVPPEQDWPYDGVAGDQTTHVFPPNAAALKEPTTAILNKAKPYHTIAYAPLRQDVDALESCIAGGYPFLFGFTVYSNLEFATKTLSKPGPNDKITPYGHAVLVTGYDQRKRMFRVRNSWGPDANDHGHFDMDYDYVIDPGLSSDFWVVYQTLGFTD